MDTRILAEGEAGAGWSAEVDHDAHADRLHTYCLFLLGDHEAAAEATFRTLVMATEHVNRVQAPATLLPWLYTLARNECLRRPGAAALSGRQPGCRESGDAYDSLERDLRRAELQSLSWASCAGLDLRRREVLELSVRHRLDVVDIALILGQDPGATQAVLDAAWRQVRRSAAARELAGGGYSRCDGLAKILESWDGRMDLATRTGILRHADECRICAAAMTDHDSVTAGPSLLPLVPAPRALRDRLSEELAVVGRPSRRHGRIARCAGPFDAAGFPVRRQPGRQRRPLSERRVWALVAAGLAVVAVGGVVFGQARGGAARAHAEHSAGPDGITGLRVLPGAAGPGGVALGGVALGGSEPSSGDVRSGSASLEPTLGSGVAQGSARGADPTPAAGRASASRRPAPAPGQPDRAPAGATSASPPAPASELVVTATAVSRTVARVTLTARGSGPIAWRAVASAPCARLSRTAGVVQPGAPQTITVSVRRDGTPEGDWTVTVTFSPGGATLTMSGHTPPTRPSRHAEPADRHAHGAHDGRGGERH